MISHLIDEYYRASQALKSAIELADDEAIAAADKCLANCWKQILEVSPAGSRQAHSLVEFLLKEISRLQVFGEFERAAAEKILSVLNALDTGQ